MTKNAKQQVVENQVDGSQVSAKPGPAPQILPPSGTVTQGAGDPDQQGGDVVPFERADWSEFAFESRPVMGGGDLLDGHDIYEGQKTKEKSPYCFRTDLWSSRRGGELFDQFGSAIPLNEGEVREALTDFFNASFDIAPELLPEDQVTNPGRRQFLESLIQTPEYQSLHARTALDDTAAELACGSFAQSFGTIVKELQAQQQEPEQGTPEQQRKNAFRKQMKIMSAINQGLQAANQQVGDYEDACRAFGTGKGGGGQMDTKALSDLFRRVRTNDGLARICQLAGRYRRRGQSMQRRKVKHGRDDVVGTVLSGDVSRAVPSELLAFVVPELRPLAYAKMADGSLLSRDYRGVERVAKGPVMIFLDESGSMHGEPSYHAKAFALTMAWIAQHQKRWCTLVAFSGSADVKDLRAVVLEPGKWKNEDLFAWLEQFDGGGTTLDWLRGESMTEMFAAAGATKGKTDVVVVTDAEVSASAAVIESCRKWKAEYQAKIIGLVIGCQDAGSLGMMADKVFVAKHLDVNSEGIDEAFSI